MSRTLSIFHIPRFDSTGCHDLTHTPGQFYILYACPLFLLAGCARELSISIGKHMKKECFEEFLSAHEKRIFRYLLGLTASEDDAKDLVQAVFIAIYNKFEGIEEATALSYTYRVAHNKAMTFLKRRSRYVNVDPTSFVNVLKAPTPPEERDYTFLHNAMKELPHRMAAVIQLQYYEKLSYKEISAHLGISVKAVESLLVRAKRILRKKIVQDNKEY
jgi:RNA polymerase sigma-70 factor (ECF subfamily)